jgi:hypothetical protein
MQTCPSLVKLCKMLVQRCGRNGIRFGMLELRLFASDFSAGLKEDVAD